MSTSFTINAATPTAGQALAADSSCIKVSGNLAGGDLRAYASTTDGGYEEVKGVSIREPGVYDLRLPAGTYVQLLAERPKGTPAATAVIW